MESKAEVIGAGLAGLTAATALAQRGWRVRLHERDGEIRAIGAGIYVWGNGLATLQALGLYDRAVEGAHIGTVMESRDHNDRTVESIPINRNGRPRVCTIQRDHLVATLLDGAVAAGVEVCTGSENGAAEVDGTVVAADGSRSRADLVVAADGVNSRIRDHLCLLDERTAITQGATRLTVPRSPEFVSDVDQGKYIEYFSGRRRVLYTPSSAGRLYIALVTDMADTRGTRVPVDVESWRESFPQLGALFEASRAAAGRWDTFEFVTLKAWSAGRIAVLGDAAHAQPPYLGQGGGCAMMNALGLADAVSLPGDEPIPERLRGWERRERPTIEHTQRWSYGLRLVNRIPDQLRSPAMQITGRIRRIGRSRMAAALTTPTGFDRFVGNTSRNSR